MGPERQRWSCVASALPGPDRPRQRTACRPGLSESDVEKRERTPGRHASALDADARVGGVDLKARAAESEAARGSRVAPAECRTLLVGPACARHLRAPPAGRVRERVRPCILAGACAWPSARSAPTDPYRTHPPAPATVHRWGGRSTCTRAGRGDRQSPRRAAGGFAVAHRVPMGDLGVVARILDLSLGLLRQVFFATFVGLVALARLDS